MPKSRFAGLRAMADGSLLRTDSLHDKEYLVVPIVSAVGDRVWWPANSPVKELVPAEVLEAAYWSRNNRPIVAGHPKVNGEYVSANSPSILEQYSYGFTCNSTFEDKRVKVEAWFSREMAEKVGPAALNVISRLENGEMIEVSEGNYVVAVDEQGQIDGEEYKSKWITAINDHLATVNEGACNNEMGCGGPRVNQTSTLSVNEVSKMNDKTKKDSMFRRMFASMSEALKAAMSNNELRTKLFKAVSEKEMGVDLVYDEDVEAKTFIYRICIRYGDYYDSYEYDYKLFRRSFEISGNDVTIMDDAVEVEWFEGWRDKSAVVESETKLTASETVTEPCSCHNKEKEVVPVNVNEKKTLITKLIGAAKSPFEESDRGMLEGMKEEKLTSLVSAYEGTGAVPASPETTVAPAAETTPVVTPTTTVTTSQAAPDQVTISKEEYSDIKAAASAYRQQQEQHRASIISSIKTAQSAFTDEDLNSMPTPQLEKLATTLNVNEPASVDYSVRGLSRPMSTEKKDHTPPKSWDLALAERDKKNQSTAN